MEVQHVDIITTTSYFVITTVVVVVFIEVGIHHIKCKLGMYFRVEARTHPVDGTRTSVSGAVPPRKARISLLLQMIPNASGSVPGS